MSRGTTLRRDGSRWWWRKAADVWRRSARKRFLRKLERQIMKGRVPWGSVTLGNARAVVLLRDRHRAKLGC